jgi:hypothetical protein
MSSANHPPLVIDLCDSSDDDHAPSTVSRTLPRGENSASSAQQGAARKRQKTTDDAVALVFLRGGDDGVVTEGLFDALATACAVARQQQQPATTLHTCCGGTTPRPGVAAPAVVVTEPTLTLLHIGQTDKWSCGYRNLQMLLAALVPTLPPRHDYLHCQNASQKITWDEDQQRVLCFEIPSQPELEDTLEASWRAGFDASGAAHYNGRVRGQRKWIGAVEVWSTLASTGVDACVVQFIRCAASRRLLGRFCAAYFCAAASPVSSDCPFCSLRPSQSLARMLLAVASSATSVPASSATCACPRLPLYLQWEGHSVTIVGVECNSGDDEEPVNLLLMDPVKSGSRLQASLRRGEVQPARLDLRKLAKKDCQIILASRRVLPAAEASQWKEAGINAVTAAEAAVLAHSPTAGR